ncbi:enoyl-CoA hydratase [Phyllobacterium sp. SYP-B3895]|uniref:MaoC family dehydratase n=1 Tax=Phyllobacterium sp. SYP-B3895 TaxID=2663240 RepID=UPI001299F58C|nr:MaoC family dehydratase [Phyllobacterium sp. SYP-B3895]MRG56645.1 enoyl-CoA hydratase [Phyllobacterium sp. SYP-B3895]
MAERTPTYAYEDFIVGSEWSLGSKQVTTEEIIDFARQFDPQPFHLNEAAGKASILGGLAASGWHTVSMFMRMLCDAYLLDSTSQGAPGIDFVKWKHPVLAGDTLTGRTTILEQRLSKSKPSLGFVKMHHDVFNQDGTLVCELEHTAMFSTREPVQA